MIYSNRICHRKRFSRTRQLRAFFTALRLVLITLMLLATSTMTMTTVVWYTCIITLRASLSGTFLQTLPDLVTPRKGTPKLQALVYDILPSTTAVFSYAIRSRKLSATKQSFVGAQTVVSLLQTTQIKQGVSFIAANKVYASTNKTTIV